MRSSALARLPEELGHHLGQERHKHKGVGGRRSKTLGSGPVLGWFWTRFGLDPFQCQLLSWGAWYTWFMTWCCGEAGFVMSTLKTQSAAQSGLNLTQIWFGFGLNLVWIWFKSDLDMILFCPWPDLDLSVGAGHWFNCRLGAVDCFKLCFWFSGQPLI